METIGWLCQRLESDVRSKVPRRDPAGSERLERVSVAQQLLLLHLVQDVLAEHTGEAELAVAHQREHQVHQLFQDVIRQFHQTEGWEERCHKRWARWALLRKRGHFLRLQLHDELYSPQLVDHTDQHEERVLADSLFEGVWTVAETSVCALWSRPILILKPNKSHSLMFHYERSSFNTFTMFHHVIF